jgi:hypothetical protein
LKDDAGNESEALSFSISKQKKTIITHNDITYDTVISPHTGRIWLDRNLGASMVCKNSHEPSCYGDYYQWGRNTDGHEKSNSSTTSTQATDINSAGDKFITSSHDSGTDWTNADSGGNSRNINWSKTDGTSVCPLGFRVPTISELKAETINVGVNGKSNAFNSFLKFPYSGQRTSKGSMSNQGNQIFLWSSQAFELMYFYNNMAGSSSGIVCSARSVRCIKD